MFDILEDAFAIGEGVETVSELVQLAHSELYFCVYFVQLLGHEGHSTLVLSDFHFDVLVLSAFIFKS